MKVCNSCKTEIAFDWIVYEDEKYIICKYCAQEEGIDNLLEEFRDEES